MPLRRFFLCALALAILPIADATAATKSARVRSSSIADAPATLAAGSSFVARGKLRNTGARSGPALLELKIRTTTIPYRTYALGSGKVRSIKARRTARFAVRVGLPRTAKPVAGSYVFVVCVRAKRGATRHCRKARRRVLVGSPGTPVPSPAATSSPAPSATATAGPSATATPTSTPSRYQPGARTANDSLFADIGNGGYDVKRYDLTLDYVIETKALGGTAVNTLTATQDLSSFSFDLSPWMRVSAVAVDGVPASFTQAAADSTTDNKLVITPAAGIDEGEEFVVSVAYAGITKPVKDPDGADDGWIPDTTRGAIVVAEPIGSQGWFPVNNIPFDKATTKVSMTVPDEGWDVVGTGVLTSNTAAAGKRTFVWDNTDQTAPYLLSVSIGKFDDVTTTDPGTGKPFTTAVDSSFTNTAKTAQLADLNRTPAINAYFAGYYGVPYPFTSMGGVVPRQNVGYSLETQGKPTYAVSASATSTGAGIETVAHENGHMWFGNLVTLTQWKDIWLNEGMTEFSAWLWSEVEDGGQTLDQRFTSHYVNPLFDWSVPPADPPTAAEIFNTDAMYNRGAMTMVQIRAILGDTTFKAMMKRWLTEAGRPYGNATTEQFTALVKATDPTRAARWDEFFQQWLYTSYTAPNKPTITSTNF